LDSQQRAEKAHFFILTTLGIGISRWDNVRFRAGRLRFSTEHIASHCPQGPAACAEGQRGDGRYSAKAAAALLKVSVSTIADWCKTGRLDSIQTTAHGPWWVHLPPEKIAELQKPVQRRWQKRSAK
jgi:hypothetical protein